MRIAVRAARAIERLLETADRRAAARPPAAICARRDPATHPDAPAWACARWTSATANNLMAAHPCGKGAFQYSTRVSLTPARSQRKADTQGLVNKGFVEDQPVRMRTSGGMSRESRCSLSFWDLFVSRTLAQGCARPAETRHNGGEKIGKMSTCRQNRIPAPARLSLSRPIADRAGVRTPVPDVWIAQIPKSSSVPAKTGAVSFAALAHCVQRCIPARGRICGDCEEYPA